MKILYNNSYGDFSFSKEFDDEYIRRTGKKPNTEARIFRLVGPESIRTDPVAVALWEEKGSEWCSGPGAAIELYEIPAVFEHYWEIEENNGDESVRVLISEALADILHDYMGSGDMATLVTRYRAIMSASTRATGSIQTHAATLVPILKRQTLVNPDELGVSSGIPDYGFFSTG